MASDAERPANVSCAEAIFTAALALPPAERAAYLARACMGDEQLRQRVEALLEAYDAPEGFLPETPAGPVQIPTIANFMAAESAEHLGNTIGQYKLREKIGEGGC